MDNHTEGCRRWMAAAPGQRACVCEYGNPTMRLLPRKPTPAEVEGEFHDATATAYEKGFTDAAVELERSIRGALDDPMCPDDLKPGLIMARLMASLRVPNDE